MPFRSRLKLVLVVLLVGLVVDQATKELARQTLRGEPPVHLLGDTIRLQYSENDGAFLSLGSGLSDEARFWVFTVLVGATMVVLGAYTLGSRTSPRDHRMALAWVLSGGTSNLLDRIFNDGRVVDFLNVGIGSQRWTRTGIFNVADMAILGGCLYLLFWGGRKPVAEAEGQDGEQDRPAADAGPAEADADPRAG